MGLLFFVAISLFGMQYNESYNDTAFVNNYLSAVSAKQNKVYRDIRKISSEFSPELCDIYMVPTLLLKKDIEWNYDNFENNAQYAGWEYLDLKKFFVSDIVVDCRSNVDLYTYSTSLRGYLFRHYLFKTGFLLKNKNNDTFAKAVSTIKPQGIFEIADLKGWFIIIDNHIYFLNIQQDKLEITDDALERIKKAYTDPYYIPITSGTIAY